MVAPQVNSRAQGTRPVLGHVNLMVDTFIANASVDDLRAIIRSLIATDPPNLATAFTNAARSRLRQTSSKSNVNSCALFVRQSRNNPATPTQHLHDTLARTRSLYGAGMGFASLSILASIVRASVGLQWEEEGELGALLVVIDADIGQAIQSSKEEMEGGRVNDMNFARKTVDDLRRAVKDSMADVRAWGGEFPFERAASSLEHWKF